VTCHTSSSGTVGELLATDSLTPGVQYGLSEDLGTTPLVFEPQVDWGSAVGVLAIAGVVVLLQVRANAAARAREGRAEMLEKVQQLKVKMLEGEVGPGELEALEAQVAELERQEEEAKTLMTVMGMSVRVITPQPLGTPVEALDSKDPRNVQPSPSTEAGERILSILTVIFTVGLIVVGAQMTAVDPVTSGKATYVIPSEVESPFSEMRDPFAEKQ